MTRVGENSAARQRRCAPRPRPGKRRPSRAARSSPGCGCNKPANRRRPSGCAAPGGSRTAPAAGWQPGRCASARQASATGSQATPRVSAGAGEGERASRRLGHQIAAATNDGRPGNADAGGMAGDGARHHPGVDLVGQQLQTGHVGAGPADAGQRAQGAAPTRSRRPGSRTAGGQRPCSRPRTDRPAWRRSGRSGSPAPARETM